MSEDRPQVGPGCLRVRVYPILVETVEAGVQRGWRRAYKHDDNPPEHATKDAIIDEVLNAFCERFDFD